MYSYGAKVKNVFCLFACFVLWFLFLTALGLHWDMRFSLNITLGASLVTVCRLSSCPTACDILVLSSGMKPTSLALEDTFLTTGSLGKSQAFFKVLYDRGLWSTGFYAVKPKYYVHSIHLGLHLPESHRTSKTQVTVGNRKWLPAMQWVKVFVSDPGVLCLLYETMAGRLFLCFRHNMVIMTLCLFTAL